MVQPAWTAWALATWVAAFGVDTWQNNSLIEKQPRMRPALSFFSKYAGSREGKNNAGAWAMLRDGLDISNTARWPEAEFGKVIWHPHMLSRRELESKNVTFDPSGCVRTEIFTRFCGGTGGT